MIEQRHAIGSDGRICLPYLPVEPNEYCRVAGVSISEEKREVRWSASFRLPITVTVTPKPRYWEGYMNEVEEYERKSKGLPPHRFLESVSEEVTLTARGVAAANLERLLADWDFLALHAWGTYFRMDDQDTIMRKGGAHRFLLSLLELREDLVRGQGILTAELRVVRLHGMFWVSAGAKSTESA